ncbi:hypothetical protein [Sorangium sp. So ce176]|uniref:hypothetical protein n=1 Tax=Sorangium sp. So ce176 TaxID=3133286 RepID=UPI003F5FEFF0
MSRYRSEIDVVRLNIQELEDLLRRVRAQQAVIEANQNLGPLARRPFSRFMYRLGRALGRRLGRRPLGSAHELAAARTRLVRLEQRVASAEAELARAMHKAASQAQAADAAPASVRPHAVAVGSVKYALGRPTGRLRRR